MAGSNGIRAGRAFVELNGDDNLLQRALRRAEAGIRALGKRLTAIGTQFATAGAALGGALAGATKIFADAGDRLDKMSKRTGLSVETLSELDFAAQRSGTSLGTLENGIRRMQGTLRSAERGLSTAGDALNTLGLDFRQIRNLSPEDQFTLIAQRLSQIEDPTRKAAVAQEIFGRAGTQLLPLFEAGEKGMAALRQRARELGVTLSTETATKAAQLTDAMGDVQATLKAAAIQIGAALAGNVTNLANAIAEVTARVTDFVSRNSRLVVLLAKVSVVTTAAGLAMIAAGKAAVILAAGLKLARISLAAIPKLLAAVASPLGLVTAVAAGLGFAFVKYTDIGKKAVAALQKRFGKSVGAMGSALRRGDIELAGKILWGELKLLWLEGTNFIHNAFGDMFDGVIIIFKRMEAKARKVWNNIRGFFDLSFIAEQANKEVEARLAAAEKAIVLESKDRQRALDEKIAAARAEIDNLVQQTKATTNSESEQVSQVRNVPQVAQLTNLRTGLDKLFGILKKPRELVVESTGGAGGLTKKFGLSLVDPLGLRNLLPNITQQAQELPRLSSLGTFSSFGAAQLTSDTNETRQLEVLNKIERHTRNMSRSGGLRFT